MIRLFVISTLLSFSCQIRAQEIIIRPPVFAPFGCTDFYEIYTGTVVNFSSNAFVTDLVVEVDYTSPSGRTIRLAEGVLTSNGGSSFAPGTTIIDNASYERIFSIRQFNFFDRELEQILSRTKCLPPGQYDICLTLYDHNDPSRNDFLTQTCYSREKEILGPLLLVSPFENEEIMVDLPLFSWTAVTPIHPGAMYRLQIVELLVNQTPFEALRSNPIFYEVSGLKSNIYQYAVAARPFLPCHSYAWRITYELESGFGGTAFKRAPNFLQESEVWVFHTQCDEEEEEPVANVGEQVPRYYFELSLNKAAQTYQLYSDTLWFVLDNSYEQLSKLNLQLEEPGGKISTITCCIDTKQSDEDDERNSSGINYGKNYLAIDLSQSALSAGKYYKLIFKDFKHDLFINFKYKGYEE